MCVCERVADWSVRCAKCSKYERYCSSDPLSDGYLLVACRSGTLHMYDVESKQPLQTFDQEKAVTSVAWVPGVPGDFITASFQHFL